MSMGYGFTEIFDITTWKGLLLSQVLTQGIGIFYLIFCIGKYGQTIGKFAAGVKVYQLDEQSVIGYKRAFLREIVPITVKVITLVVYYLNISDDDKQFANNVGEWITFTWFIVVLVTMLTSPKRRAIHDLLASSIVVDIDEQQREIKAREKELSS